MRVALAQMGSVPGDFGATVERMLRMAEQAARRGADLVVYPATVLSGAYPLGLCEQRAYQFDLLAAIEDFAASAPLPAAVPAYVSDDDAGYTEVFLCAEGTACPLRRREAAVSSEDYASTADAPATCTVEDVRLRFLAGETALFDLQAEGMGCDAAVSLSPAPYCYEDASTLGLYGAGSSSYAFLANGVPSWFILLQGVGAYDDVVLAGGSFAAAPDGTVAACCPLFEEALATADLAPVAAQGGPAGDAPAAARVEPAPGTLVGRSLADIAALSDDERCGYLYQALTVAVRDYVRKSGFSDVAVGLSGGIDSAVVAALATDALGPEHVLGVLMPGPHSSEASVDDALELAARLGIRTRTVPVTGVFESFLPLLGEALGAPVAGLARENLQARLRGCVLMTISNATGALVLNTGNKSESGMGYSTLYGDTVGAFAPLADVYKGGVYRLARWRNGRGPLPVVPRRILDKPPSAELSEGQTDEASLGAPYEVIDRILTMHVERGLDGRDIAQAGFAPETVDRVLGSVAAAEYKRRQEPFGPVVSLRPLADRGWPVVCGWRDRTAADAAQGGAAGLDAGAAGRDAGGCGSGGCRCAGGDGLADDEAELETLDRPSVDDALDAMLARAARQDQAVGVLGDVAFGAFVSGRGPDMDDCLGMPLFSKN